MAICILYKPSTKSGPRFYRVEIAMNLFEEVSVFREWGVAGGKGQTLVSIFGNLREASNAADTFRKRAQKRGYERS
ncbi:WGR domain-containing protein [Shimia abyssi]|uniref:WGR domain-containing protein n=1 Tax=Shimia abyssi TaxID=1662395 RepID=A0A2P8F9F4_9RHOB|nr:WGR domain-containing protein [Shimia abyssi]PSL18328.1 WGR domain-containing protein [Shimia abyssi]